MNVNNVLTKDYKNKTLGERGKKQSQTNPNKAKFKKAKMNITSFITKDYENMSNWAICENKAKTNPIKPNFRGKKMLLRLTINGWRKKPGAITITAGNDERRDRTGEAATEVRICT